MTEMKWTRIAPGHYETAESYNGYRYRITQHKPGWPWGVCYRWDNDSTGTWRSVQSGRAQTLKACKYSAARHNVNPRERWVFAGRDEKGLQFVPADQDPNSSFRRGAYLDPAEITDGPQPRRIPPLPEIFGRLS